MVVRHDAIRDVQAGMITEHMGVPVHAEQRPPGDLPDERRPDIDYHDKRMVRQYLDVAVVTPHIRALPGDARLRRAGALIEREESNKIRKYRIICSASLLSCSLTSAAWAGGARASSRPSPVAFPSASGRLPLTGATST